MTASISIKVNPSSRFMVLRFFINRARDAPFGGASIGIGRTGYQLDGPGPSRAEFLAWERFP